MAYMRAEMAAMKAGDYAGMNVLALLSFANADSQTDTIAREHAIDNVAIAIAAAAGTVPDTDADNDGSTTDGDGRHYSRGGRGLATHWMIRKRIHR